MQERAQRQRERIVTARHQRTARVLRGFWHTHGGVTWQDGVVLTLALAGGVAAVIMWPMRGDGGVVAADAGGMGQGGGGESDGGGVCGVDKGSGRQGGGHVGE